MLLIKHFFRALQLARAGANTQALEEGNVELGVDAAVLISPRLGDTALALQYAKVLGANPEPP